MLVLDASAVVALLLGRPGADEAGRHMAEHDYALHAPHLLDVEVWSALRRLVAAGDALPSRAEAAMADLAALRLKRYPHGALAARVWALRENISAYDATYVALAELLSDAGATLVTADVRLARASTAHSHIEVELVG